LSTTSTCISRLYLPHLLPATLNFVARWLLRSFENLQLLLLLRFLVVLAHFLYRELLLFPSFRLDQS